MSTAILTSRPHLTLARQSPVDESGRLVHADDPAAQLALAVTRLEAALARRGRTPAGLDEVDVLTTDRIALLGVLDVLTDRLAATGARPHIRVIEVDDLGLPGQLVALGTTLHPDTHEGTDMTITQTSPTAAALAVRDACPDLVRLPGDDGYDEGRTPWNVAVDQRPAAVAVARTVDDVQAVVRAAAAHGLRVAPQSSGHGAAPLEGRLSGTVLLRLHRLTGVEVDSERRIARVVGGTLWRDVVAAAAPYGLSALPGSAADVAVAGYVLGGGLSFLGRQHGLASTGVTAVEVVTADGELVRATADHHPDLFWAVRGGGGSFGVVVALELALLPIADLVAGMLLWPLDRADDVARGWVEWTREVPDSVSTCLRVMSFPPLPELPPFLSGRRLVVVDGALLEDDDRAAALLAPLRAMAPEIDTFGRIPAAGLLAVHMDPPGPTPAVSDHAVLTDLDDDAVDAFLGQVGTGTTTSLMFAELRHLGGAYGRPAPDGGALDHLPGGYGLFGVAVAPVPEAAAAGRADSAALVAAMAPWSSDRHLLNFSERVVDPASAYDDDTFARLLAVRAQVDPSGLFLANHELP